MPPSARANTSMVTVRGRRSAKTMGFIKISIAEPWTLDRSTLVSADLERVRLTAPPRDWLVIVAIAGGTCAGCPASVRPIHGRLNVVDCRVRERWRRAGRRERWRGRGPERFQRPAK